MLSSLALALPATAAQPVSVPAKSISGSFSLAGQFAGISAGMSTANYAHMPAGYAATAIPASFVPTKAAAPTEYTVLTGDTVSAIAGRFGLDVRQVLDVNNLGAASLIHPGQTLRLTDSGSSVAAPAAPAPSAAAEYTVQAGDTISAIAAAHSLSINEVLTVNNLSPASIIRPGQSIKLTNGGSTAAASAAATQGPTQPAAATTGYVIKAGDTLSAIAAANNVSVQALASANAITANSVIHPGQRLTLPGSLSVASSEAPTQLVPSTFLHYTYPEAVVSQANVNKAALLSAPVPTRNEIKDLVATTAARMGVTPSLALAFALQESGFNHRSVSPANAIGTMQVIPQAGEWASELVGRHLNLLDPQDNVTAGIAIIRALVSTSDSLDNAIAGYYQGQYSVSLYGMYPDTANYVASVKKNALTFG
ncbi:LysM peptidoglycan-binding domain-containing protein [Arthrobacter sp. H14-L1]|uniref:LysM peptidoglycan-binding domain-containing protein n=1 Tax=Arthrobacter sp. H14-L1 TaxID=2996697 RepID=UPI00226E8A85|nr:LysM peptidoglycan-binding domain-containing protein [Arthrobacter sp. H14-L1]